jgi:hypothetical protein
MILEESFYGHTTFSGVAHQVTYFLALSLSLSAGIESLPQFSKGPGVMSTISQVRSVVDPALFGALGVISIVHVHESQELIINYHTAMGWMLITLGVVILMCSLTHSVADWHHPACRQMRLVLTFAWLVPGGWFMQMSLMVYAGPFGIDRLMEEYGIHARTGSEAIGTLFSCNLVTSSLVFLVLASGRSPDAREFQNQELSRTNKYIAYSASPIEKDDDSPKREAIRNDALRIRKDDPGDIGDE